MKSLILSSAARFLCPVMAAFGVFLLLRGHHEPGGGFAGGLTAASAAALHALAFGTARTRQVLRLKPLEIVGAGLAAALTAGILPMMLGKAFLEAVWWGSVPLLDGFALSLGTPLLFDIGVFLIAAGMASAAALAILAEGGED